MELAAEPNLAVTHEQTVGGGRVAAALPDSRSRAYLDYQARRESNARSYPRRIPLAIVEAEGLYVKDADGNKYMDCLAGAGTLALGHNHPVVVEAIRRLLDAGLPLHALDLTTPVKDGFMKDLFASLPPSFAERARIQFCSPSGSDAVEAAVKLVKTATGRRTFLSFHGGYHGMTQGALGLMGNLGPKLRVPGLMQDVHFLPYPYSYRCPFGLGGELGERAGSHYIETVLSDSESGIVPPAGLILELVQGEGGVIPAPDTWVQEVRRITRDRGIPMIVDEVQTGWGRTGKLYAFEHSGVIPDVVVLSKAIGGSLPLAVILYDESLDKWGPGAHAGTFRGNQMAMAAGIATLRFLQENDVPRHAQEMGDRLKSYLWEIQAGSPSIGEVRGRGLMLGVEIVNPVADPDRLGSRPHNPALARQIQTECLRRGLILELGGRHSSVVRLLPPLIVTPNQVDAIAEAFEAGVRAAERNVGVAV